MADLDALTAAALAMDLTPLRSAIAHGVRLLRSAGIGLTDRRVVKIQRLIAAAGALAGREQATEADLWPIVFALPSEPNQQLGRDVLRDFLIASENGTLLAASAEGSLGPRARAARILRHAAAIMTEGPQDVTAHGAWRLRIEGIAREIDASFTPEAIPAELAALRARIVETLAPKSSKPDRNRRFVCATLMRIPFVARPDILDPIAVVGLGRVAGALARRLHAAGR